MLPCTCGATIIDRYHYYRSLPLLSIARHYYRSPAIIIDRLPLLSIATIIIDRPPLLSIAMQRHSIAQLINNDNRAWVRESATGGLSHPFSYLIIIIIP
jgi:hypothetical protein